MLLMFLCAANVLFIIIIIIIKFYYYGAPQPVLRSASQHKSQNIKYIKMKKSVVIISVYTVI